MGFSPRCTIICRSKHEFRVFVRHGRSSFRCCINLGFLLQSAIYALLRLPLPQSSVTISSSSSVRCLVCLCVSLGWLFEGLLLCFLTEKEQFFQDQISFIHETLKMKEKHLEQLFLEEHGERIQRAKDYMTKEEGMHRKAVLKEFLGKHAKKIVAIDEEKDRLMEMHEEKRVELKRRYLEELLELEMEFESAFNELMEKHVPPSSEDVSTNDSSN